MKLGMRGLDADLPQDQGLKLEAPEAEGINADRRKFLSLALLAGLTAGCSKIEGLFGGDKKSPAPKTPPSPSAAPSDPNRPEFLDEDEMDFHGLTLLMANNDQFDRYIFNAVTGNRSHAQTLQIQKGYTFNFEDGRSFQMPYHAFLFIGFDERSNLHLPKRLGEASKDTGLATFFKKYTIYRADNPKHIAAIKTILITSYDLSFGLKLDSNKITIENDGAGRIKAIKYAGPLVATTSIAAQTEQNPNNPEAKNVLYTQEKSWNLVGPDGELTFPPSVFTEQGIALPYSALPEYKEVKYAKTFKSQGRNISLNLRIPIDSVISEERLLMAQGRTQNYEIEPGLIGKNLGYYVLDNDPFVKELARLITNGFTTKRQKMQAILDFAHSYNYVPDAYGEAPRTPIVSLICKGGDCEDSSILVVALARSLGIDCVFAYFDGHAAVACDVDEGGSAFKWGERGFEWCETTGGEQGLTTRTNHIDAWGTVVKTTTESRGWRIGEKPPNLGPLKFISRVEDKRLTRFAR